MKAAKSGKKRATAKAPKKAPVKKAAKRAVKKIAPKKTSIAAIKPISFTPKDLDKLKEAMLDKNLPKEIRAVLDAASKGNFDAFNGAVQSLSPKRLGELVGALDWDSEAGSAALGKLDKGAQAFKEGVLHGPLPDAPTLVKCCCDPRIFGELRTLCHGLFCCCRGCCCSWDDLCLRLRCRCGIPVYKGTETTSRRATSFRFTDDFSVTFSPVFPTYPYLPAQATIDFNSGLYYTKTDVDGLLTGKANSGHDHDTDYETIANVNLIDGRVTTLEGRKNTLTIKDDFTIANSDSYPYDYDLSALTCAYGDIQIGVSGVHGAAASTALANWLRFTWSVDAAKKLSLHLWSQAGAECSPSDIAWDGTEVHLKITAVG
ncbi:MAG: hypothetical protein M0R80_26010 [Proteobacteria bacterium]|jgi:hypothetical protein|nr:hypothetical protein [Pseudomonadota bacterium]